MELRRDENDALSVHGIKNPKNVYWNLSVSELYSEITERNEGSICEGRTLIVTTGQHTGRSPQDSFIVKNSTTENSVDWGAVNKPFPSDAFDAL